ncbi:MAG: hypothetical protein V2G41_00170 [bacterium JZ-2024 1]
MERIQRRPESQEAAISGSVNRNSTAVDKHSEYDRDDRNNPQYAFGAEHALASSVAPTPAVILHRAPELSTFRVPSVHSVIAVISVSGDRVNPPTAIFPTFANAETEMACVLDHRPG